MAKRPIDSFLQYFLDIKPYHTKILEIVEQYKFQDYLNVTIDETITFLETWANDPLCSGVGYGLDFDDEAGYDAISNCDLFECVGGYGLVFDNSDILLEIPVTDYDIPTGTVTVSGDYRYDTYFQIAAISGTNTIKILGNVVAAMSPHYLFLVIPRNKYAISEITYNGFYVAGNVADQFLQKKEFNVMQSGTNDDIYSVENATYIPSELRTFVEIGSGTLDVTQAGFILVASGTKNNRAYVRTDVSFDGTHTNIILQEDSPLALPLETKHGVVVLRTGLIAPRRVWLDGESEWKIVDRSYDLALNETTLSLEGSIDGIGVINELQLIGYAFGAGFDGSNECGPPSPNNLHVGFSEYLTIEIISYDGNPMFLTGDLGDVNCGSGLYEEQSPSNTLLITGGVPPYVSVDVVDGTPPPWMDFNIIDDQVIASGEIEACGVSMFLTGDLTDVTCGSGDYETQAFNAILDISGGTGTYTTVEVVAGTPPPWMNFSIVGSTVEATGTIESCSSMYIEGDLSDVTCGSGEYGTVAAEHVLFIFGGVPPYVSVDVVGGTPPPWMSFVIDANTISAIGEIEPCE